MLDREGGDGAADSVCVCVCVCASQVVGAEERGDELDAPLQVAPCVQVSARPTDTDREAPTRFPRVVLMGVPLPLDAKLDGPFALRVLPQPTGSDAGGAAATDAPPDLGRVLHHTPPDNGLHLVVVAVVDGRRRPAWTKVHTHTHTPTTVHGRQHRPSAAAAGAGSVVQADDCDDSTMRRRGARRRDPIGADSATAAPPRRRPGTYHGAYQHYASRRVRWPSSLCIAISAVSTGRPSCRCPPGPSPRAATARAAGSLP